MNKSVFGFGLLSLTLMAGLTVPIEAAPSAAPLHWQPLDEPGSGGWMVGNADQPA